MYQLDLSKLIDVKLVLYKVEQEEGIPMERWMLCGGLFTHHEVCLHTYGFKIRNNREKDIVTALPHFISKH